MAALSQQGVTGIRPPADLVPVGYVTGAYGIGGWIKIRPYSAQAEALLYARSWWLDKPVLGDFEALQVKRHGAEVVALLMGLAGRDVAEALKGAVVQIRRSHFPVLAEGEFYWTDLIGMRVENLQQQALGRVADLMDNGAHPILRVAPTIANEATTSEPPVSERLIPFVAQFIIGVDQAERKITVDWGLDY